jgi:steroid delta-isomerase-like uncharacterized protein
MSAAAILTAYYEAFHREDHEAMLELLDSDVIHYINQDASEQGIPAFRAFLLRMQHCYRERLENIVIMTSADGSRAAAEFVVHGTYLTADEGLPLMGKPMFYQLGRFSILRMEKSPEFRCITICPSGLSKFPSSAFRGQSCCHISHNPNHL